MALRWAVETACHVLGHPGSNKNNQEGANGVAVGPKPDNGTGGRFQMPLHYPRYSKADYERMEERKVELLLREYGIVGFKGTLQEKRDFAIGAFLWPHQY